ncbi:MAG: HlyD family efflux transporter periplasmic adaptor subunit [Alphaproteobacteria bacterium]|nr:HlyD family efflux transporter periplasmic adaptor subunit [Alphaproteobacteria bacterium]
MYYEQSQKYFFQLNEIKTQIQKAYKELTINTSLHKDKVISAKELFDVENNFNRLNHTLNAFKNTQIGIWQQEYQRLQLDTSQIFQELQQLHIDNKLFVVKSPVDGIVQGIQNKYAQNSIYPNEVLCSVSPNDNLVAECYINAKDIGLIKLNQKATLQIDAFDYKYFGVLNAVVSYIDNDYNVINNSPVFKVRCNLNQKYLISKLGYKGDIKKGLSLQAKFFIIRRSLWQLLYDKMDNWLNPMNQSTKN